MKNYKFIGMGGIGTALAPFACRYLNFECKEDCRVTFIDGDGYEKKNETRQRFKTTGNKAKVSAEEFAVEFENISFRSVKEFVTPKNIASIINEGDTILMGVDNHAARKLVSDYCKTLNNVVLISGGNELTDGNVQVYIRKDGKDVTASLTKFHPEIENPADKNPGEMSCEERAKQPSSRQILVTNMGVAWRMFNALWHVDQGTAERFGESYLDINEGAMVSLERKGD
jgi:molybdopterin/thiamine biosynthesis adenylyltransferase